MSARPPVKDWATDFDHLDPRWVNDPFPIWDEMRKTCPIAHTERFMGVYFPSRYEDVRAVAYDTEHFSSRRIIVRETPPPRIPGAADHLRSAGASPGAHGAAAALHARRHEEAGAAGARAGNELIDKFVARGTADAAVEYAQEIPVRLIAHMLGLPESDGDLYRKWIKMVLEDGITECRHRRAGRRRDAAVFQRLRAGAPEEARRRPDQLSQQRRVQGREADAGERDRLAAAAADRGHRHHLERHRLVHLASGQDIPRTAGGWCRSRR